MSRFPSTRSRPSMTRMGVAFLLASLVLISVRPASATATPVVDGGRIRVTVRGGGRGPLVLGAGPREPGTEDVWTGGLVIANVGDGPLTVSRIAIRGDEDDVRSPSQVSVRFADGASTTATLAPGASKEVVVSYLPEKNPHVYQAFGHVVVTSTDERAGEVAMGFRVQLPTGLGWVGEHALSLLVSCPLLIVLVIVALRAAGRRDDPVVPRVSVALSVVELSLAIWAYRHFAPDVGRADGNDGFQLVERCVWVRSLGAEWYLGVDGTSLVLVLMASFVCVLSLLIAGEGRRTDGYYATFALLSSGIVGVLLSLDMVVLFTAWATVVVALVVLVGGWGREGAQRAAAKLGAMGAVGSISLLIAISLLAGASNRSFLVDGTAIAHTMSVPELARTSYSARGSIVGIPLVDAVWALLFVAAAVATPIVSFHGWLADVLEEGPAGLTIVVGAVAVSLGPYLLLRLGIGGLPEGAEWAGSSLAVVGAVGAAWGAFGALAQRDLRRFVAYTVVANGGLCLYGLGSMTSQGITAGVMALWSHGFAATILLALANAFERRVGTCDTVKLKGLARDAPVLGALLAVGLAVSMGVPGLVGSWPIVLALVGGLPQHPLSAILLVAAIIVGVVAHARIARLLLFEAIDPHWRQGRQLEAFDGRLPDVTSLERNALIPIGAMAIALGLWPAPVLAPVESAARDAATFEATTP